MPADVARIRGFTRTQVYICIYIVKVENRKEKRRERENRTEGEGKQVCTGPVETSRERISGNVSTLEA